MPLPLYGSGGRRLRISAATWPTRCLSIPSTCTRFVPSTVNAMPSGAVYVTGCEKPSEKLRFSPALLTRKPTPWSSSDLRKPLVTPSIMFATSVRVRPCAERPGLSSLLRATTTWPPSIVTVTTGRMCCCSEPFGPLTATVESFSVTSTPDGMATGSLPMRDMIDYHTYARTSPPKPSRLARLPDMMPLEVDMMTRPSPPRTRGISVFGMYTRRPGRLMRRRPVMTFSFSGPYLSVMRSVPCGPSLELFEPGDEAFVEQDLRDGLLHLRRRDVHGLMVDVVRVADAREQVRDRIGDDSHYQLAFVMPGMKPRCAFSRKQIRHMPNLR